MINPVKIVSSKKHLNLYDKVDVYEILSILNSKLKFQIHLRERNDSLMKPMHPVVYM